ncbi:MAG: hypothetical protein KBA71_04955 [Opitutaceae bacterium]|nr:hypothetical protein [Opitutaceae bacterium]
MALWEYKIIGSGKGGFGSPSLLESHLNQLGKDEWEIIAFHTHPDNPLAFHGLARRTTQRDWTLQDAAAAAAKAEAEKLRAEFAAKFQAAQSGASAEENPASLIGEVASPEDGLRRLRDTDRDQDPEALADSDDAEEMPLDAEDELPTFFDYIRPYMRRNQRGPGLSLAVDYLANKIDQSPGDIVTALKECGFVIPEDEDDDPSYLEYDGDLFWVNVNRHHQLFINTKEKPRPVFRAVKGQTVAPPEKTEETPREGRREGRHRKGDEARSEDSPAPQASERDIDGPAGDSPTPAGGEGEKVRDASGEKRQPQDRGSRKERAQQPAAPVAANPVVLPGGEELLARLRPHMRRNRRGPGMSGSISFLSRALDQSDAELTASLAAAGFSIPEKSSDRPSFIDAGSWSYWINKDNRGGLWINGRERRSHDGRGRGEGSPGAGTPGADPAPASTQSGSGAPAGSAEPVAGEPATVTPAPEQSLEVTPAASSQDPAQTDSTAAAPAGAAGGLLASVRGLLKTKPRSTTAAGELETIAQALYLSSEELLRALSGLGLTVPPEGIEKSDTIEVSGDLLWISRARKGGVLSLNAKAAKPVRKARPARKAAKPGEAAE